jgi:serralysin
MVSMDVSRRSVLAAIPLMGCAGEARAQLNRGFITPDGEGDGSSWSNAASISDLADLITNVERGGEVLIAADRGEYRLEDAVEIGHGGVAGHEIVVRGANSETDAPMLAVIRGDRGGDEEGTAVFRLRRGANHLRFSHFAFRDIGNGAFHAGAPISNLTIEDCSFENIYRFLENTADGEGHASMDGFVVRRCRGSRVERGFLRVRYNSRNGLIEDCAAQGQANQGGFIPAGCALDDRANSITYRRCVMENFQQWGGDDYWNGDGFSDEPGNARIRYESCEARGSTDGGFDCKSRDVAFVDCIAEDNKRNFRIWSDRATMTNCTSRAPNFRGNDSNENATSSHLWIGSEEDSNIDIENLIIEDRDATPIIEFEHDVGRVEIRGVTINSPRINWGNDEGRIRARMLIGEPVFRQSGSND